MYLCFKLHVVLANEAKWSEFVSCELYTDTKRHFYNFHYYQEKPGHSDKWTEQEMQLETAITEGRF